MNRYIITYFSDPGECEDHVEELNSFFVEGLTEDDAKDKFLARVGSYSQIISCNLTVTSRNTELPTVHGPPNRIDENLFLEEVTYTDNTIPIQEKKKVKTVNRGGKISNASLIRLKIAEAKSAGKDKDFVVDWAVATLGQTKPVAKSYVKNIWSE